MPQRHNCGAEDTTSTGILALNVVRHPDIRLPISASSIVDGQRGKSAGKYVSAVVGKCHCGPRFPVAGGRDDLQRFRLDPQHPPTESHVQPHPRVERQSIVAPPARVLLDRNQRITVFPIRPDQCDQPRNSDDDLSRTRTTLPRIIEAEFEQAALLGQLGHRVDCEAVRGSEGTEFGQTALTTAENREH